MQTANIIPEWDTLAEALKVGLGYSDTTLKRTKHTYNVFIRDYCDTKGDDAENIIKQGIVRTGDAYESYSELDDLGRCQEAKACVGLETMPDEERGNISEVKPTGWQSVEYDQVDGGHLYNRCHLIGFQLTGENANERNLITGTRYMNTEGMLPFENEVADYVKETGNHVLYQVTPVFEGDNLVASGVWMEAESVEDGGRGVSFNVYVFNIQPGIEIDYSQGNSWEIEGGETYAEWVDDGEEHTYILNTNTKKFHDPDCSGAADIKPDNKETYTGSRQALLEDGYGPCGSCDP